MVIVEQIAEACSETFSTSNINLFAKIINGYKVELKHCQTSKMGLSRMLLLAVKANSVSCQTFMDGASVFL